MHNPILFTGFEIKTKRILKNKPNEDIGKHAANLWLYACLPAGRL
jgi:hypothetical protein